MEFVPQWYDTIQRIFPQPERFPVTTDNGWIKARPGRQKDTPSDGREVFLRFKRLQPHGETAAVHGSHFPMQLRVD